jgi:hypothetical protein
MKKLALGLIAIIFLSFGSQSVYSQKGSVEVTFEIGRKSKGCEGFGICKVTKVKIKIEEISLKSRTNTKTFNGTISSVKGKLLLSINKDEANIVKEYFNGIQLIIEEEYLVDDREVLKDLGVSNITVGVGTYNFKFNENNQTYELFL